MMCEVVSTSNRGMSFPLSEVRSPGAAKAPFGGREALPRDRTPPTLLGQMGAARGGSVVKSEGSLGGQSGHGHPLVLVELREDQAAAGDDLLAGLEALGHDH